MELTAYCGLYCGDCIRYRSKAADLARNLISELQEIQFDKYAEFKSGSTKQFDAVKQFELYRECCEVLEAIIALQCNNPCRVGGGCSTSPPQTNERNMRFCKRFGAIGMHALKPAANALAQSERMN